MALHSISHAGMRIFDAPIESIIGGVEVDLASAPITPGEHRLEIDSVIGGIEIYLPRYVTFTIEGGRVVGGKDVHEGRPAWLRAWRKLGSWVGVRPAIPDRAVPQATPALPIVIRIVINGAVGGLDIYRL